jgi:hypothetical protein
MTTHNDDFWGDQADWADNPDQRRSTDPSAPARRTTPTERAGPGAMVARWWDSMLSGRSTATRTHGMHQATTAAAPPAAPAPAAPAPAATPPGHDPLMTRQPSPTERPHAGVRHADVRVEDHRDGDHRHGDDDAAGWDDGWDTSPAPASTTGVDPLVAKFGGLAVVLTLLVPLAMGFRSGSAEELHDATPASDGSAAAVIITAPPVAPLDAVAVDADATLSSTASTPPAATDVSGGSTAPAAAPTSPSSAEGDDAPTADDSTSTSAPTSGEVAASSHAAGLVEHEAPGCAVDYAVVAGDYWIRLADGADVSLNALLTANGASTSTPLYPGRTICLPAGAKTPPPPPAPTATPSPPATTPRTTTAPKAPAPTTTPTTPPTTAAPRPTAPAPPAPAYSRSAVEQIIRDVWPDHLEERALQIAWRESSHVPTAKNYCCYGLFQIYWNVHKGWLAGLGVTSAEQLYDPTTNARAAYTLYQRAGGWGPWGF